MTAAYSPPADPEPIPWGVALCDWCGSPSAYSPLARYDADPEPLLCQDCEVSAEEEAELAEAQHREYVRKLIRNGPGKGHRI